MVDSAAVYVQQHVPERYISASSLRHLLKSMPHEFGKHWSIKTRHEIHCLNVKRPLTNVEIIKLQEQCCRPSAMGFDSSDDSGSELVSIRSVDSTPPGSPQPSQPYYIIPTSPSKYYCLQCNQDFVELSSLQEHIENDHAYQFGFSCIFCNDDIQTRDQLEEHHQDRHSGLQEYVCGGMHPSHIGWSWGCHSRFANVTQLHLHLQSRDGAKCIEPLSEEGLMNRLRSLPFFKTNLSIVYGDGEEPGSPSIPAILLSRYPELQDLVQSEKATRVTGVATLQLPSANTTCVGQPLRSRLVLESLSEDTQHLGDDHGSMLFNPIAVEHEDGKPKFFESAVAYGHRCRHTTEPFPAASGSSSKCQECLRVQEASSPTQPTHPERIVRSKSQQTDQQEMFDSKTAARIDDATSAAMSETQASFPSFVFARTSALIKEDNASLPRCAINTSDLLETINEISQGTLPELRNPSLECSVPFNTDLKVGLSRGSESDHAEQKDASPARSATSVPETDTLESELSFAGTSVYTHPTLSQVKESNAEAWDFLEELARRLVRRALAVHRQNRIISCTTPQTESTGSASQTSNRCTQTDNSNSSVKRSRGNHDGHEDAESLGDRRDDRSPSAKRVRTADNRPARLFACPYTKFDPERYSERNQSEKKYRKCASTYLPTIARLKQHLYRTHMRPPWYCGSCYEIFETREGLNRHNRQRPPCEQQDELYEETMTDEQFHQIKRRSQNNDNHESWYKIFRILFPGARQPLSPYVSTSNAASIQDFVNLFRWFGPEEFFNLLRDRRERNNGVPELEASTQAVVDEAFEIAVARYLEQPEDSHQTQSPVDVVTVGSQHREPEDSVMHSAGTGPTDLFQASYVRDTLPTLPDPTSDDHFVPQVDQNVPSLATSSSIQDDSFDPLDVDSAFDAYDVFTDVNFPDSL